MQNDFVRLRKMSEDEYVFAERQYAPDSLLDPVPLLFDEARVRRAYAHIRDTYGIFLESGQIIGYLSLKPVGEGTHDVGVVLLNDSYKGKGYGTAAVKEAINLAAKAGVARLTAKTDERNTPMQAVLRKLGFIAVKKQTTIIPPSLEKRIMIEFERTL